MHSRNDGTCSVLAFYRHRDVCDPAVEAVTVFVFAEAGTFVSEIPCENAVLVFETTDHVANIAYFPHYGFRIVKKIKTFESRGNEHSPAHPARKKSDNEFHTVLFGNAAEGFKAFDHNGVDSRATFGSAFVGQILAYAHFTFEICPCVVHFYRLEIRPEREDAHYSDVLRFKARDVRLDNIFTPVVPHFYTRVRRPVVTTDFKFSAFKNFFHIKSFHIRHEE